MIDAGGLCLKYGKIAKMGKCVKFERFSKKTTKISMWQRYIFAVLGHGGWHHSKKSDLVLAHLQQMNTQ